MLAPVQMSQGNGMASEFGERQYTPREPARGTPTRHGERQICCVFDEDTFQEISAIAATKNVSFRSLVRSLVEFGLEDFKQAERRAA